MKQFETRTELANALTTPHAWIDKRDIEHQRQVTDKCWNREGLWVVMQFIDGKRTRHMLQLYRFTQDENGMWIYSVHTEGNSLPFSAPLSYLAKCDMKVNDEYRKRRLKFHNDARKRRGLAKRKLNERSHKRVVDSRQKQFAF